MHRWQIALSLVVVGFASHASGQGPNARKEADARKTLVPAQVTPEMWIYSQEMRRYEDPQQMVRRKAEVKSAQRNGRLAAMKWFGFSNSRPQANPVPFMGAYSPTWVGNGYDRYDWVSTSWPAGNVFVSGDDAGR
jgi:hypothetical protein